MTRETWPWRVACCSVKLCVAVCVAACCITGVAVCCDVAVASRVLQCGAVCDTERCSVLRLQKRHWYILQIDLVLSWDCATWSGSANVCVCTCVWERERERKSARERVRKYVFVRVHARACVCVQIDSVLSCGVCHEVICKYLYEYMCERERGRDIEREWK